MTGLAWVRQHCHFTMKLKIVCIYHKIHVHNSCCLLLKGRDRHFDTFPFVAEELTDNLFTFFFSKTVAKRFWKIEFEASKTNNEEKHLRNQMEKARKVL